MSETIPESEILRLRRLVSETDIETSTYTDAMLTAYIERNDGVVYWAAAEICREKSAAATALDLLSLTAMTLKFERDSASYFARKSGSLTGSTVRVFILSETAAYLSTKAEMCVFSVPLWQT